MTDRPDRPEFASAMRGYDRMQVDDYLDRLVDIVNDAEERARAAEAELEFSRHTTVGPRVAQILDLAVEEAKDLRERVAAEVEQRRADVRAECEELRAEARRDAEEVRTRADEDRRATIADAEARRGEILAEVERLRESKAGLLGDLGRLQELLAQATGVAPAAREDDADAHDDDAVAEAEAHEERVGREAPDAVARGAHT